MTQINWGVLCCFNIQSTKRCHAERNTVFLEIISYPFAFKKLYSKAFFVWKKWLLREDRHTSPLRTTVLDESTDGSLIIEGIIPDILKLTVKWWLKLFKNINHSLSATKARSSSCWGSSFLPRLLPLLAANMTAFSTDGELERRTVICVRVPTDSGSGQWERAERWQFPMESRDWEWRESCLLMMGVCCHQWDERGGWSASLASSWKRGEVKWCPLRQSRTTDSLMSSR